MLREPGRSGRGARVGVAMTTAALAAHSRQVLNQFAGERNTFSWNVMKPNLMKYGGPECGTTIESVRRDTLSDSVMKK